MEPLQALKNLIKGCLCLAVIAAFICNRRKPRSGERNRASEPALQQVLQYGASAAFGKQLNVLLFDPGVNVTNNFFQ
jgi:hypothetical protein